MKLVAIGFLGDFKVYVNVTREEAINQYNKDYPEENVKSSGLAVRELDVENSFHVYDIWINDEES